MSPQEIAGAREALQQYGQDTDDSSDMDIIVESLEKALNALDRMQPVYDAAIAFVHAERHEDGDGSWRAENALIIAADAATTSQKAGR